jgi:hypothetical protein
MEQVNLEKIKQVVLIDLNRHSLPRILSLKKKLDQGKSLIASELEFLSEMIVKINICQRGAIKDIDCTIIYTTLAHLVSQVVQLAFDIEKNEDKILS